MELALNPTSGNDVVVDYVQHCQPSCLSSVLKGGPLYVVSHCEGAGHSSIGRFSEAGLLECMRFAIFRARSRERSQRTSGPISE